MARFDSDQPGAGGDEENVIDPLAEDDMKINLLPSEEPERQQFSLRRVLLLAGIVVIVLGGGYLAYTLFLAPPTAPPVPLRTPTPVAKAPAPAPPPAAAPQPAGPQAAAPAPAPAQKAPGAAPQPAKPEAAKTADAAAPGAPAKDPAPPASKPGEPVKAADAAKPPAPARPAAPMPARGPAAVPSLAKAEKGGPGAFSLQVGAMAVQSNAENLKKRLDASGFPCTVRKGVAHLSKHVVTVDEPTTRRDAEDLARRLNVDGFPSVIVATEGKFTPQVGAFISQDEAIDLAREIQKKQYRPKIAQRAVTSDVYQVRHGEFDSRAAALKRGDELRAKGFGGVFVVRN
jgi:cell division septation protein DedD